jgi:hypothetical protein
MSWAMVGSSTRPALADAEMPRLGALLNSASLVVIGVAHDVQSSGREAVITFDVIAGLTAGAPARVTVRARTDDPEGAQYAPGVRKLLFLRTPAGTSVAEFEPVDPAAGVIEIAHGGAVAMTLAILRAAAAPAVRLADVRAALQASPAPPPRPLVQTLLAEIASHLSPADRIGVVDLACSADGEYLPAARLWAIEQAGLARLGGARRCLEALATRDERTLQLAAVEALGDLGEPGTGNVLLEVLERARASSRRADELALATVLALGKLRDPAAAAPVAALIDPARVDVALDTTVIHALGLIGSADARQSLERIRSTHASPLIRDQARRTAEALDRSLRRQP